MKTLQIGPVRLQSREIDLREFGFIGTVSDEAIAEIRELDRRAAQVIATSDRFWFR